MRRALVILLMSVVLASCTEDKVPLSGNSFPISSPTASLPSKTAQGRCHGSKGEAADVNGDGQEEVVYHSWVKGRARVGVCFSNGVSDTMPGLGQAESMIVLHEDVVDRDVVLFGASGMTENTHRLAVWKAGRLQVVGNARTQGPLEARSGIDPETGVAWSWGWNCNRIKAPGTGSEVHGVLVQVKVKKGTDRLLWNAHGYYWRHTALATSVSARRGSSQAGDALRLATKLTEGCHPQA